MVINTGAIGHMESQNTEAARGYRNHVAQPPLSKSHWLYRYL